MARTTSFVLGEHFSQFVEGRIDSGQYNNASEVVRAGLRLLEGAEQRRAAVLRTLSRAEPDDEPVTDADHKAAAEAKADQRRYSTAEVLALLDD